MSIYTLGIDIGSTASKCIILKDGKDIVAKSLVDVGAGTTGPARAISEVLESANMKREDLAFTLATGYGRNSLEGIADKQMSELSCHAMGAHFLWPNVHTVIDIGGQDAKVIHIENGAMTNFQMNDVPQVRDVSSMLWPVSSKSRSVILLRWGRSLQNVCLSAQPARSLRNRKSSVSCRKEPIKSTSLPVSIVPLPAVAMTGGVAQNYGIVHALEEGLGVEIKTSPLAQYNGALGAALYAYRKASK